MDCSWKGRVQYVVTNITLEPVYLLASLGLAFQGPESELKIQKSCQVDFGYTLETCTNITQNKQVQSEVQRHVTNLGIIASQFPVSFINLLVCILACSWSDRNGRNWMIIMSISGFLIKAIVLLINTIWWYELNSYYLFLTSLSDLTGSGGLFFVICNCYMADITDPSTRTKRIAFISGMFSLGGKGGGLLSGYAFDSFGFLGCFLLSCASITASLLYVAFAIPESLETRNCRLKTILSEEEYQEYLGRQEEKQRFPLHPVHIKDTLASALKKREHGLRTYILMIIFSFLLENFINRGEFSHIYMYLKRTLDFEYSDYANYVAFLGGIALFSKYICFPIFIDVLHFDDTILMLIDTIGTGIQSVLVALATQTWMIYVAAFAGITDSSSNEIMRSLLSKQVPLDEIGKILGSIRIFGLIIPYTAGPLFGFLYRETVETAPNAFLFLIAAIFGLSAMNMAFIRRGIVKIEKIRAMELRAVES
ncbi:hypothetical protein TCAL_13288 [Tigriopus californicus]|uniref:Major facilitator superfamily (MFS) profile domain-containing protein n=1 Tax=Tigriopus californicus TaxID=6832 RepID=A0A553NZ00_TIGCA|nr:proton-coupled folate transporter-like [Tigriopus californicus]TRY70647.1 hypothetical protein TCAL_13288 [Tigriopus californicus]